MSLPERGETADKVDVFVRFLSDGLNILGNISLTVVVLLILAYWLYLQAMRKGWVATGDAQRTTRGSKPFSTAMPDEGKEAGSQEVAPQEVAPQEVGPQEVGPEIKETAPEKTEKDRRDP